METAQKSKPRVTAWDLKQFTGSETWTRYPLFGFSYTDGVQYLAQHTECYWILDAIGSHLPEISKKCSDGFIILKLTREGESSALLQFEGRDQAGEQEALLASEKIEYTDFPFDDLTKDGTFTLFIADNGARLGWTVLLTSEY